jgi:hypothetical protein
MELKHKVILPSNRGQIVEDYLKVLKANTEYPVFTLDDDLEIIECKGLIANNGSWNYHNNYDDSENVLYVFLYGPTKINKWFTLNKDEAIRLQKHHITQWEATLRAELKRLKEIVK